MYGMHVYVHYCFRYLREVIRARKAGWLLF